jgi:hypothetical protein
VAEVKRPALILHETEMKGLDTLRARATLVLVLAELQARAAEANLLHEDALIADGNLEWESLAGSVESRSSGLRKLEDLRPRDVVSLDEAWVVRVPTTTVLLVEIGERCIGRNPTVEDDRAYVLGLGTRTVVGRSSRDH